MNKVLAKSVKSSRVNNRVLGQYMKLQARMIHKD